MPERMKVVIVEISADISDANFGKPRFNARVGKVKEISNAWANRKRFNANQTGNCSELKFLMSDEKLHNEIMRALK